MLEIFSPAGKRLRIIVSGLCLTTFSVANAVSGLSEVSVGDSDVCPAFLSRECLGTTHFSLLSALAQ